MILSHPTPTPDPRPINILFLSTPRLTYLPTDLPTDRQEHQENRKRLDDGYGGPTGLAKSLRVDLSFGLAASQVELLREAYGPNSFPEIPMKGFCVLFAEAFNDTILLVLIAAAVVSLVIGLIDEPEAVSVSLFVFCLCVCVTLSLSCAYVCVCVCLCRHAFLLSGHLPARAGLVADLRVTDTMISIDAHVAVVVSPCPGTNMPFFFVCVARCVGAVQLPTLSFLLVVILSCVHTSNDEDARVVGLFCITRSCSLRSIRTSTVYYIFVVRESVSIWCFMSSVFCLAFFLLFFFSCCLLS